MNGRAAVLIGALAGMLLPGPAARAQMMMQPTPRPIVTAENERWFQEGVPVIHAGNLYYPAGPRVNFNGNEMVRTGHFNGIPIYSRKTIEPFSVVFVPLTGGWMQPYERRRAGELADTAGSMAPSFPVVRPVEQASMEFLGAVQAPSPATQLGTIVDRDRLDLAEPMAAPTVGTTGLEASVPLGPLMSARRPEGLNGVFIEYENRRYFSDGPAVPFDEKAFKRIGTHHGFPVYRRAGQVSTVYVPPLGGSPTLVTPYRTR